VDLGPPEEAHRAISLPLAGRDDCSFHPHGISLVETDQADRPDRPDGTDGTAPIEPRWLLYVVNHHEPEDARPEAGCFPHPEPKRRADRLITSIEVFVVERHRLVFLGRLARPEILTNGNDLVALPDGRLWVTNPPPSALQQLREALFGPVASKVVHVSCAGRPDLGCREKWSEAWTGGQYVNGIAHAPATETEPERLFVAATAGGGTLHVLDATEPDQLDEIGTIPIDAGPDNLEWLGTDHQVLVTAAHPNLRRFLHHAWSHRVRSPSRAIAIPLDQSSSQQVLFDDDGGLVSGASTAACFEGDVILGQVFGPAVLRCQVSGHGCDPPTAAGDREPRETP